MVALTFGYDEILMIVTAVAALGYIVVDARRDRMTVEFSDRLARIECTQDTAERLTRLECLQATAERLTVIETRVNDAMDAPADEEGK